LELVLAVALAWVKAKVAFPVAFLVKN